MITYSDKSLFDVPKDSVIVHACNSQGMWGSGIAEEFSRRYPHAYAEYRRFCEYWNQVTGTAVGMAGMSRFHVEEPHWVGWLVTSHNYGQNKDDKELIKVNTTLAIEDMCKKMYSSHPTYSWNNIELYSNKFNSGLFGVPWEETELILSRVLENYERINWIVCDPKGTK